MCIEKLELNEFIFFNNASINLSKGINILIGENGVGKTQLLKALYTKLNYKSKNNNSISKGKYKEYFGANPLGKIGEIKIIPNQNIPCTYIPSKDMLTHSNGFLSLNNKYSMPFDKVYYDIVSKALIPLLNEIPEIGQNILPKIEEIIDGKVIVEDDTFFVKKSNGDKVNFAIEAEGLKKIATIWQLIMNDGICADSILFWDQPESNINPKLIPKLVDILLELSRNNVQIFIATHDYIFAKYVEVLSRNEDNVLFHNLVKNDEDNIEIETQTKFSLLSNNSIRDENVNLYEAEIDKVMVN